MANGLLPNNIITQVAIVTDDIVALAARWAAVLGVPAPEPHWTDTRELAHTTYRGEPTEGRSLLAFFDLGPQVRLELIQPDEHPSTWREFLDRNGTALHHIAFNLKGMDEVLATLDGAGMPTVQRGDYTGGRYAYVDSEAALGCILELLENF
ncbi:MAG: VOC family protein [Anaerolineae bacterium]|jgi:methylmalonyl-CoA/ethylmalonyl-CoA epimerase|nr:VOC family protein [Chloroflexota bacterium]